MHWRWSLIVSTLGGVVLAAGAAASAQQGSEAEQRREARRRILVNDDGEVILPGDGRSWEDYLGERFHDAIGTQVDSYFLNIGATDRGPGIRNSLQSSMAYWAAEKRIPPLYDEATRRYIEAARQARMEIFASIRMNDVHDSQHAGAAALNYPLKVERPDLLLGSAKALEIGRGAYESDAVMGWFWPGLDWAKEEVRGHFLDFIAFYCPRYDFDGVELDYFRHPLFFKLGEEERNLETMTGFVRSVRETLNRIGKERGRPYLLAIRVPDSPAFARRTGLDVERWLREGLLDVLVVGGGYMPYSGRLEESIDLARRYHVPAYPCLNHFRGPVQMQSVASNFWALGGDGFYLFNYFGVTGQEVNPGWGASTAASLKQVGDPRTLRGLEKLYRPDEGTATSYIGYNNATGQLPVRLIDGTPVELVVGDDVERASAEGRLRDLRLRVGVANVAKTEGLTLQVNGAAVPAQEIHHLDEHTFAVDLCAPPLRQGINTLVFLPGEDSTGRLGSQVTAAELSVRYKD